MSDKAKIAAELSAYREFKKNYEFTQSELTEKDGILYCEGFPLKDAEGKFIPECEKWINVGYKINGSLSKLLSNLYPYEFEFRGFRLKSIESCFQGIKYKDPEIQKLVFNYSGTDAYHLRAASAYDWKISGYVYWQGKPLKRDSAEYEAFTDELYISAAQNPLFRQALKNAKKPLIHSIGVTDKNLTVLTRYEYERQINSLADFIKQVKE